MMAEHSTEPPCLSDILEKIPKFINKDDANQMINLQVTAIDRLESTNKSLINCNTLSQNKLTSTTKLYKKAVKQLSESKKDLDVIYKKILDLKARMKADRPDLLPERNEDEDEKTDAEQDQRSSDNLEK